MKLNSLSLCSVDPNWCLRSNESKRETESYFLEWTLLESWQTVSVNKQIYWSWLLRYPLAQHEYRGFSTKAAMVCMWDNVLSTGLVWTDMCEYGISHINSLRPLEYKQFTKYLATTSSKFQQKVSELFYCNSHERRTPQTNTLQMILVQIRFDLKSSRRAKSCCKYLISWELQL